MQLVTTAAAGLLAMAIVSYLGLVRFPVQIEQHLLDSARASLAEARHDWATVRVSGRDLHLAGTPPGADAHRQALNLLSGTRGLRIIIDDTGPPGAPQPATPAVTTPGAERAAAVPLTLPAASDRSPAQAARLCQTSFNALLSDERVMFVPGKAVVSLESAQLLQQVAQAAQRCSRARLEVAAHTYAQGDPADNFEHSQRQAEAVVEYLVSQGVASARLEARGYGSQAPIASNRDAAGRERNRRIEITVLRGPE